ncbi:profilin-1A-like isoform X1 [Branchiostoma lanceolatum]|uniref:Profilin n=1 Tax=Branchiostoma lanceolatum TaxID=7740 RepID=A0A8J9Z0N5_BRALA|nr:PFN4 [Branchiostoma lanceolatum]
MSWQSYIDQSLLGTGQVAKAAIHGLDGSAWATSNGFKVTADQVLKIVNAFNSGTLAEFYTSGMYIGTETTESGTEQEIKYKFIKQNGKAFYVKEGDTGACVFKTNTCLIIAVYEDGMQAGNCNDVVEKLGEYLLECNF